MTSDRRKSGTGSDALFIQFARSPVVGEVKTRLAPALGEEGACELHCQLVRWTCRTLVDAGLAEVELHVAGQLEHPLFRECLQAGAARVLPQRGEDLGARMHNALVTGLERFRRVVLVGSDCPGIDTDYLSAALAALDDVPVVIGPAQDGGYVLLGAGEVSPVLFRDVSWGTSGVYEQTQGRLRELGWQWESLQALDDIDRPDDLPIWRALQGNTRSPASG